MQPTNILPAIVVAKQEKKKKEREREREIKIDIAVHSVALRGSTYVLTDKEGINIAG